MINDWPFDDVKNILDNYYEWLLDLVLKSRRYPNIKPPKTYDKLLYHLFQTPFLVYHEADNNRAVDGYNLRLRYSVVENLRFEEEAVLKNALLPNDNISLLEVILALAIKIEENIMRDEEYGDRTRQWFWFMLHSLGVAKYHDKVYDQEEVDKILYTFNHTQYEKNGKGGLFWVPNTKEDLRKKDIWYQLMRYLETIS